MVTVAFQRDAVFGEGIEVGDGGIEAEFRGVVRLPGDHLFHQWDVAVIDVAVGDHVHQLAGLEAGGLGEHVDEHGVLDHIPVVGRQHILGALVENGAERVAGDIEGHGVGTGIERHLMEILKIEQAGEDTAAGGIVPELKEHPST